MRIFFRSLVQTDALNHIRLTTVRLGHGKVNNYLANRRQSVNIMDATSNQKQVTHGVRQGANSILGICQ